MRKRITLNFRPLMRTRAASEATAAPPIICFFCAVAPCCGSSSKAALAANSSEATLRLSEHPSAAACNAARCSCGWFREESSHCCCGSVQASEGERRGSVGSNTGIKVLGVLDSTRTGKIRGVGRLKARTPMHTEQKYTQVLRRYGANR
jgi:hypothetical protein